MGAWTANYGIWQDTYCIVKKRGKNTDRQIYSHSLWIAHLNQIIVMSPWIIHFRNKKIRDVSNIWRYIYKSMDLCLAYFWKSNVTLCNQYLFHCKDFWEWGKWSGRMFVVILRKLCFRIGVNYSHLWISRIKLH